MTLEPPDGGIDFLPSGDDGFSLATELFARLFTVLQTSIISIALILSILGLILYLYSRGQGKRGLQLVEGGVIVFGIAAVGIPVITEATAYIVTGDTDLETIQLYEGDEPIEIVANETIDTSPNYPAGIGGMEASLDPVIAIFGNILSLLMIGVISAGIITALFALILYIATPRVRKAYSRKLFRGASIVTLVASGVHIFLGTLAWIATGSRSTSQTVQPITIPDAENEAAEYYEHIELPHEAATPDVVYPLTPGDATIRPTLQIADRIAILNEITLAYVGVIALAVGLILYVTDAAPKTAWKIRSRQYITFGLLILALLAGITLVVTGIAWITTGDAATEQSIHEPGAPYADGTHFSSGSVEGWESESESDLIVYDVDEGGMGMYISESDTATRTFNIGESPGDEVLISVETQGNATVTVQDGETTLVDEEAVNGTAVWGTQTDAETVTVQIASPDDSTTVVESVVVIPVLVDG